MGTNKGAEVVSTALLGLMNKVVVVNGIRYTIFAPTIKKIAGSMVHLQALDEFSTVKEMLTSIKEIKSLCYALSWLIKGDESLADELSNGTILEVVKALEIGLSMIDVSVFQKAVNLTRNVAELIAKPRRRATAH